MKSIFLSIVVVCALTIAGVGGTLATWSDSETSEGNKIETGSLDLKVNGQDDLPWGAGVPVKVEIIDMVPCKIYGPYPVTLYNAGQHDEEFPAEAYFHLKDFDCYNVPPEKGGIIGPDLLLKPEPELVAEFGGKVDCVWVDGIGVEGDDTSLGSHILMIVTDTDTPPDEADADRTINIRDKIEKWLCDEIYLFDLPPCEEKVIYLWFHLQQDSEEDWLMPDLIVHPADQGLTPGTPEYEAAMMHWLKFNDWPSWALMKDGIWFDIEFDLWLIDP